MTSWTYAGTTLATFGKVTKINDYLDMPNRRSDNIIIPFRHGTVYVPKYFDQRKISMGISIVTASATALESTFDTMRGLFAPTTQQTLSMTLTDATVRTALASVDEPIDVQRFSDRIAKVVVSFTMTSPYWRLSTAIADNSVTVNATPKAWSVTNTGSCEERDPVLTLTGPLQNTVITNSANGCVLTYTGTIASPRVVTISTVNGEYRCVDDLGTNLIGNVTHSGSSALMVFNVGVNPMSIADDTHTTGVVRASFYPPFL